MHRITCFFRAAPAVAVFMGLLLAGVSTGPAAAQVQSQGQALRVAYLIPGSDKEPFWQNAAAFAAAAAEDLGFSLEVHFAFNDPQRLLDIGSRSRTVPRASRTI